MLTLCRITFHLSYLCIRGQGVKKTRMSSCCMQNLAYDGISMDASAGDMPGLQSINVH